MTETHFSSSDTLFEDFLAHHGVKGQKWGVRRVLDKVASSLGYERKKTSTDGSKSEDAPRKLSSNNANRRASTRNLTDAQLQKLINRIRLENDYANLTKRQKSKGAQFIEDIMMDSGKRALNTYSHDKMVKMLKSLDKLGKRK